MLGVGSFLKGPPPPVKIFFSKNVFKFLKIFLFIFFFKFFIYLIFFSATIGRVGMWYT